MGPGVLQLHQSELESNRLGAQSNRSSSQVVKLPLDAPGDTHVIMRAAAKLELAREQGERDLTNDVFTSFGVNPMRQAEAREAATGDAYYGTATD